MDQVAEALRESDELRGVVLDQLEVRRHLDVLVKGPGLRLGAWVLGERLGAEQGGYRSDQGAGLLLFLLLERPE